MTRRKRSGGDGDSLDLLLDTVSNVFGGVMFLTLLAALLILSRGATTTEEVPERDVEPRPVSTTLIEAEMRKTAAAIAAQKQIHQRLDPDGSVTEKADRLKRIENTLALARRHAKRADGSVEAQQKAREDQLTAQSDLEQQIENLKSEVSRSSRENEKIRAQSERAVEFRALTLSRTEEAVVMLRYGRWYLLQDSSKSRSINRDDFFILEDSRRLTRITPKPHRGTPVTEESAKKMAEHLKRNFKSRDFHVVIAVWDDSFGEFNMLKDAVKSVGFQYRTLPCDTATRLTNNASVDAYVQ